jgi:hypothetical protein
MRPHHAHDGGKLPLILRFASTPHTKRLDLSDGDRTGPRSWRDRQRQARDALVSSAVREVVSARTGIASRPGAFDAHAKFSQVGGFDLCLCDVTNGFDVALHTVRAALVRDVTRSSVH